VLSRREFLIAGLAVPVVAACGGGKSKTASPSTLAPTPSCGGKATEAETEGPYFKAGSPEKSNLRAGVSGGTSLTVSGVVLTTACQPVDKALMEVWQADAGGQYDNSGYRLRGHLFTDGAGKYRFDTVVPGLYPGRTRHIHVKVQAPNGPVLTTQLYFPNEPQNASDSIFSAAMLMDVKDSDAGKEGTYNFVVRT
jgi:protocatechuate 3,4-dioxygenase beta subunit